jgi:hypothetical protein
VPSRLGGLKAGEAFNDVSIVTKEARKVEYGTDRPSYSRGYCGQDSAIVVLNNYGHLALPPRRWRARYHCTVLLCPTGLNLHIVSEFDFF